MAQMAGNGPGLSTEMTQGPINDMSRDGSPVLVTTREIPVWRKVLYAGIVIVAFFGGAELLTRACWRPAISEDAVGTRRFVTWLATLSLSNETALDLYTTDAQRLWRLNPGRQFHSTNYHRAPDGESQPVEITINSLGYRGQPVTPEDAAAAGLTVLCLGDSNFFGYPLDDHDAFPFVLQETLQERVEQGPVCVINAGLPGYSSTQGRIWYEAEFSQLAYKWLLVSFLNNDAWEQPHTDQELLSHPPTRPQVMMQAAISRSRLLQAVQATMPRSTSPEDHVSRVDLSDYTKNAEFFAEQARQHGAQLLFIDYRLYADYANYSHVLSEMSKKYSHVHYLYVLDAVTAAFNAREHLTKYASLDDKIRRRWGKEMLRENPRLWFYAEFHPEHLNELGTEWLANQVAQILLSGDEQE